MAKKINIIGAKPKRIQIVNQPKPRLDPAEIAEGLGATPCGDRTPQNLDLISLAELGTQVLTRLRSSGGRPALTDATEICRVPLSAEDLKSLEELTGKIGQSTATKPSPGQVASIIVREFLTSAPVEAHPITVESNVLPANAIQRPPAGACFFSRPTNHAA
ncbi:MAG: hypothetical protein L0Y72_02440 [Gemmataceae bacterium]|nr:hypothetical protein [Gemmataceae bacterium]MCI0737875.1 hypothetical protein [Gemmataceae bacterium]